MLLIARDFAEERVPKFVTLGAKMITLRSRSLWHCVSHDFLPVDHMSSLKGCARGVQREVSLNCSERLYGEYTTHLSEV